MQAVGGIGKTKIEGRLRTPEYVAAAVSACLAGREGRAYDRDLLKMRSAALAYLRLSGWKDDGTMFGVRSEADGADQKDPARSTCASSTAASAWVPVQFRLAVRRGRREADRDRRGRQQGLCLRRCGTVFACTDPTESLAQQPSSTDGRHPFAVEKIDVEMDGGPGSCRAVP